MNNLSDLLTAGYEGYRGWSETEALADFQATGGSGKGGSTPAVAGTMLDTSSIPSVQSFETQLAGEENTALENLVTQMEGRRTPLDVYREFEQEAGLPQLRQTAQTLSGEINNIEDILEGIPAQVAGTTRESLVNESQRQGLVQKAREPQIEALTKLSTNLARIGEQISLASQGVNNATELFMAGQEMGLEPAQLRYAALQDRNARRLSAFTTDRQAALDELYAKWERSNQLSDMEWKLATELAQSEEDYRRNLLAAAAESGARISGNEGNDELLGLIAQAAREQTAFERARAGRSGKTSEEKQDEINQRTGEYITLMRDAGDRDTALSAFNAYKGTMEKEGVSSSEVRNAIDAFYPGEDRQSTSQNINEILDRIGIFKEPGDKTSYGIDPTKAYWP